MVPAPASRRERRRRCSTLLLSIFASALLAPAALGEPEETSPPAGDDAPSEQVGPDGAGGPPGDALPVVVVDEVTITATRSERSLLEVPGNVTVIDRETIDRSGARNVPELLRREAGIFVTNTTTNRAGYTAEARGFTNGGGNGGRTLVLIDGRRVNEPDGGLPDWAFIPLDNVESIEVVRGPVNALYGDNAIAGVIQLRTRRPEPGFQGSLRGASGTFATDQGSLWLGGGEGPVTGSLFVEGHRTNGYRESSDLRAYRAEGQVLFDLAGRGELRLAGGYDSQSRELPGALTQEEIDDDRRQAAPGSDENRDDPIEHWAQLQLDLALTEQLGLRANGWHRRRDTTQQSSDPFFLFGQERETQANALETELELDVDLAGHRNRTLLGGSFLREDIDFESTFEEFLFGFSDTTSSTAHRTLWGGFLQNELNLTEDLLLVLGVRGESASYEFRDRETGLRSAARDAEWAPKAALTWRVVEPVSLYASYARGFRFPNFDETFGVFGTATGLAPENSQSYEVGARMRTRCLTLNLAAYHMNVHDEIFYNPLAVDPANPFGQNLNVDRVRHRGFEAFASLRPIDWLEVYGSYTYDDVEIGHDSLTGLDGSQMPITPRHRGNAGARVYLPLGFEAGADAIWVGNRYLANDVANRLDRLPSWSRYDVRLGWRRRINEWLSLALDATAYNVTGERFTEFGGVSAFSPRVGFFPSPERHYVVSTQVAVNW